MMMQTNQDSVKSPYGRFGRSSWLAWQMVLVLWLIPLCLGLVVASPFLHPHNYQEWMLWIVYPIVFSYLSVLLYLAVIFSIRRLHDFSQTGWWSALLFIPVIGIGMFIYLAVRKGHTGLNEYGEPYTTQLWHRFFAVVYVFLSIYLLVILGVELHSRYGIM